jgi:hypothetical protein
MYSQRISVNGSLSILENGELNFLYMCVCYTHTADQQHYLSSPPLPILPVTSSYSQPVTSHPPLTILQCRRGQGNSVLRIPSMLQLR